MAQETLELGSATIGEVREALAPFAACVEHIYDRDPDEEWAKFRLLVGDYRRAAAVFAKLGK